jgi:hypothetical protein
MIGNSNWKTSVRERVRMLNISDVRLVITTIDDEGKVSVIEGKKKPYSWAVETLKLMTERNALTPDQIILSKKKMQKTR